MNRPRIQLNGKTDGKAGRPRNSCDCEGLQGDEKTACLQECRHAVKEIKQLIGKSTCGCKDNVNPQS